MKIGWDKVLRKVLLSQHFYESDLKQNNIDHIETVTARFKAFNEKLETVFNTETVNIPIDR